MLVNYKQILIPKVSKYYFFFWENFKILLIYIVRQRKKFWQRYAHV